MRLNLICPIVSFLFIPLSIDCGVPKTTGLLASLLPRAAQYTEESPPCSMKVWQLLRTSSALFTRHRARLPAFCIDSSILAIIKDLPAPTEAISNTGSSFSFNACQHSSTAVCWYGRRVFIRFLISIHETLRYL